MSTLWEPGDEFDQAMTVIERNNPLGPFGTLKRRLLWWHLAQKQKPVWTIPDDPFDASAWTDPQ